MIGLHDMIYGAILAYILAALGADKIFAFIDP